jgi:xanthine dehydrogenase YagS FAD-binding subunit
MQPFKYLRVLNVDAALQARTSNPQATYIAGGTELLNWTKDGLQSPQTVIDINALPLADIEVRSDGVRLGALARMSDVANEPALRSGYPVLPEALLSGASAQLRNQASMGGNIVQKTRCYYFRDTAFPCNKRVPGSGCSAIDGSTRIHAILGTSDACIAAHPSDLAVALVALDASVRLHGPDGERSILLDDFYLLPGNTPEQETVLNPGELIVAIDIPARPFAVKSHYLKVRDRASYEFALVAVAAAVEIDQQKIIRSVRIGLGGVAPKPWRSRAAEEALKDQPMEKEVFERAAKAATRDAKTYRDNAYKVPLVERTIVRVLETIGDMV